MTRAEEVRTPAGRTPAQRRNARVKVIGSLLLLALLIVGLGVRIADGLPPADRAVPALIAALVLVSVHLLSGRMRFLDRVPRSGWLSAFGGIAVAYVFAHLLPELAEAQERVDEEIEGASALGFLEHHVYLVALLGLALFYYVEKASLDSRRARRESDADDQAGPAAFRLSIGSFAGYNVLIGYLLLRGEFPDLTGLALYTSALGVHFVVNDFGLREHHKDGYEHVGRYVVSVAVLVGWLVGLFAEIPQPAIAVIVAFIGGGVILNVLKEELPGDRRARFVPFAIGAAGYAALLQLV